MSKFLTIDDIDPKVGSKIYQQDYSEKPVIDGLKIVNLKNHIGEDGDFCEIFRVDGNNELENFSGFKIAQINSTKLTPGSIKAWHLHFKQDEIWHLVSPGRILAGIWDIRKNSKTNGITMRIVLDGNHPQFLLIPHGVAHGSLNLMQKPVDLFYFVNQKFDIKDPDEKRIPWDLLGKEFWNPKRD